MARPRPATCAAVLAAAALLAARLAGEAWVAPRNGRPRAGTRSPVALGAWTLGQAIGGRELLSRISSETLGAFEDLDVNVGLLDNNDVDELSREFVKAFERTYDKLPDFVPLAKLINGISSSKSAQAYAERLKARLENIMQFPSVSMPVRTVESVAVVVREKTRFANSGDGPIVASFELTMLPRDGRKLDDEDLTSRPSSPEDSKPYLTNLFVKEEYRRRGLGSALMKLAEEMSVKSWRQDSLYLHIDGYPPSEKLYNSIGFEGVTPTDSDGVTHMSKSLEAELKEFEEFLIREAEEKARLEAERRAEEERRLAQKALGTSEAEVPQLEAPQT